MNFRALSPLLAATVLGFALTGSLAAQEAGAEHQKMDHSQTGAPQQGNSSDAAYTKAMRDMDASMKQPVTGDADVDFVVMMLPHHQGAVDMAKAALANAKDPFVLKLAADVIKSQESEIDAMKQWLAAHQKDAKIK